MLKRSALESLYSGQIIFRYLLIKIAKTKHLFPLPQRHSPKFFLYLKLTPSSIQIIRELKHRHLWATDGNWKSNVSLFWRVFALHNI